MSKLIHNNDEYRNWIQDISRRFKQSQIKAAVKVNAEMLQFYWTLGKDIASMNLEARYGSAFYKSLSSDLQTILPDVHSFSVTNLKYMRYFYELYPGVVNRQQLADDFGEQAVSRHSEIGYSNGGIFMIPWGHHIQILSRCRGNPEKALFYVHKTLENNWSRSVLMNFLSTNLYERQGKAVTNFSKTLPPAHSDLAQEMTRDPYNFDFLQLRENYDEKELKSALMVNVQKFLLELGTGFAFVGREY